VCQKLHIYMQQQEGTRHCRAGHRACRNMLTCHHRIKHPETHPLKPTFISSSTPRYAMSCAAAGQACCAPQQQTSCSSCSPAPTQQQSTAASRHMQ
jgi:hypothetical protein